MTGLQPCSSLSGSWLVYVWQKVEESSTSSSRGGPFPCFPFVKFNPFLALEPPDLKLWPMYAFYPGRKCCHQDFAFPNLLFLCRHCHQGMHPQPYYIFGVLPSWSAYLLQPTCHPQEQWLEVQSVHNPGNLTIHTQMFNTNNPVSMFFDACVAIDKGGCRVIGCGCGGPAWEKDYASNNKYMCWGDNSWPCNDVGYHCPYWGCVSWAIWQKAEHTALLHKGTAFPDCTPGTPWTYCT
jgi:hypothetical protein